MDPEAPRALGDLEDAEPERHAPIPKKTLDQFLEEFEANLRDHPGQAATSATAALEGRAEGAWRTPVEGIERYNRRLPRRLASRPTAIQAAEPPAAAAAAEPAPPPAPVTRAAAGPPAARVDEAGDPSDGGGPDVGSEALAEAPPGTPAETPATALKRRHRHRRHHRHR